MINQFPFSSSRGLVGGLRGWFVGGLRDWLIGGLGGGLVGRLGWGRLGGRGWRVSCLAGVGHLGNIT